jgi:hypothetical protein
MLGSSTSVAFVMSGELRSFAVPEVHGTIHQNVIRALCPSPSDCTADVFACAQPDNCQYTYWSRSAAQVRAAGSTSKRTLAALMRNLSSSSGISVRSATPAACADRSMLPPCASDAAASTECAAARASVHGMCAKLQARHAGAASAAARLLNESMRQSSPTESERRIFIDGAPPRASSNLGRPAVSASNASMWGNVGALNSLRCFERVVAHEQAERGGVLYDWIVRLCAGARRACT